MCIVWLSPKGKNKQSTLLKKKIKDLKWSTKEERTGGVEMAFYSSLDFGGIVDT